MPTKYFICIYLYQPSVGPLQRVAEALRLAAKLLGLRREASPSAEANSMGFFILIYEE